MITVSLDDPGSFRVVRIVLENTRFSMFSGRPGAHHHWSQSIYISDLMAKELSDLKVRMSTCNERSQTNILESGTACECCGTVI